MIKYGVVSTKQPKIKLGWDNRSCPDCGANLTKEGSTFLCPNDGTKPFEEKELKINVVKKR